MNDRVDVVHRPAIDTGSDVDACEPLGVQVPSIAELDQLYGRDADNVLTNHRTKLIYPSGLSDLATIQYVSELVRD